MEFDLHNFFFRGRFTTLHILSPSAVQKSYGSERRFFNPPPCVYIQGDDCKSTDFSKTLAEMGGRMLCTCSIGETSSMHICHFVEAGNSLIKSQLKSLHVSDEIPLKNFPLHIDVHRSDGGQTRFSSRNLRVISKPSKRTHNLESKISSGCQISVLQKSQHLTTKFMSSNPNRISVSTSEWGVFTIYLVARGSDGDSFEAVEGDVYYGSRVRLVCLRYGLSLPVAVVESPDGSHDDLLFQHLPCCFRLDGTREYLCYLDSQLLFRLVGKSVSTWVVSLVDLTVFSFSCPGGFPHLSHPSPLFDNVTWMFADLMLVVFGDHLTPFHVICLENVELATVYRSQSEIVGLVGPDLLELLNVSAMSRVLVSLPDVATYETGFALSLDPQLGRLAITLYGMSNQLFSFQEFSGRMLD